MKSWTIHAAWNLSTNMEIVNDFKANVVRFNMVKPQASNTRKKLNNSKECEAIFHSDKSDQGEKARWLATTQTYLFRMREFSLLKSLVSPTELGMPAPKETVLLSTRKFTLGKGLLNTAIVENIYSAPESSHWGRAF